MQVSSSDVREPSGRHGGWQLSPPDWLVDCEALPHVVSRVRQAVLWRVSAEYLKTTQDDATLLAIREIEMAGVEVITDAEIRRESCSNRFATALDGGDIENPGEVTGKREKLSPKGLIRRSAGAP